MPDSIRGGRLFGLDGVIVQYNKYINIRIRESDEFEQQGMIYYRAETTPEGDRVLEAGGALAALFSILVTIASGGTIPAIAFP